MFKVQFAQYINNNMVRLNLTYKDIAGRSGVPPTTVSYYARGQVTTPNDEYCARIAAVFGDGPEVIQQMRRDALKSTAAENKILAESDDAERMEKYGELMRKNMLSIMEEFRASASALQADELRRASELNAKVLQQCNEEIDRNKKHNDELLTLKDAMITNIQDESERVRKYLKRIIRNLSIALIAVSLLSAFGLAALGGYAFYAYHTFDREDPTRGLYRAHATPAPDAVDIGLEE